MAVSSHFEIEPLILQTIDGLGLAELKTIGDETVVAGRKSITDLLPAVILFTDRGQYSEGTHGAIQTETQYWQLSVIVKHVRTPDAGETTASRAGLIITPVLAALLGVQLSVDFEPLEIVERVPGRYVDGHAEFPFILKTSLNVGAGA